MYPGPYSGISSTYRLPRFYRESPSHFGAFHSQEPETLEILPRPLATKLMMARIEFESFAYLELTDLYRAFVRATPRQMGLRVKVQEFVLCPQSSRGGLRTRLNLVSITNRLYSFEVKEQLMEIEKTSANESIYGVLPSRKEQVLELPLMLSACLQRFTLSVAEVMQLDAGSIIEIDIDEERPIDVLLGEELMARARLLELEGKVFLEILEVCDSTLG